jgi:glycosyltransferase involved in cell wall biosynthesis
LRCLWLARALPLPLNRGDNVYSARLAQALAAAGVSVTFIGLAGPASSAPALAEAFDSTIEWCIAPGRTNPTVRALASRLPLVAARFGTRRYARHLAATLRARRFDAIVLDHCAMVWAIAHAKNGRAAGTAPLIVHIAHNFETGVTADIARNFHGNLLRKAALQSNARKTADAELALARCADIIVSNTVEDSARFARLAPSTVRLVVPPGYDGPRAPHRQITAGTPRRVAILGNYEWSAKQMNLSRFFEAADPILYAAGIGLDIAGDGAAGFRKVWEARTRAARFYGFVDNLSEFLAARRIGLSVEETGGGFKHKLLNYIFNRLPVAAIRGSTNGLPLTAGHDYLTFESMSALAQGVTAVIDDIERLNQLQDAAYQTCEGAFDWADRGRSLAAALRQALDRRRAA